MRRMTNNLLRLLVLGFALLAQAACTSTTLPPYEASYTTKIRGVNIKGVRKFEHVEENRYRISWKARKLWMQLQQWSEFEVVDGNTIRPISYHYTRKGLGTDRPVHIYFDWERMQVNGSKGKKEYQYALEPGTLDRLSYEVQMQMDMLRSAERDELLYRVANHDRLKTYRFKFQRKETIDTALGEVETLVYARSKKKETIEIWLSPEQYYLPVRVEQLEDDRRSVIAIKSWAASKPVQDRNSMRVSRLNPALQPQATTLEYSESSTGEAADINGNVPDDDF